MQIWIHDSKMKKIVVLNNNIPEMLHYSNSAWHPYLDQATSTFDFTIPKFVNGKLHEDIKLVTDECFVSFYINGSYQVFYIATLQEDDFNIQLTCNNTNLEYALEYANPFSAGGAQTIEWYLNHMELLSFAAVELGYNEIPDRKRTLTFDSQETKATRLQSLMSSFEAEYEFKVDLNRDGTYKRIVINIYQKSDETHHGIGSVRGDVVLYYDNGLKGVQVNSDKTQMFNAGVFTGKDGLSLADVEISEKNADGIEEYYSRKGSVFLFAPLAMARYPATMRSEGQDNWIRKDFTTEYENVNDLKAYALRTLKQYAYPLMTYTASVQSNFIGQYTDLKLGDTVKIIDKNFAGGLALEARVSEMIISFNNPNNNSLVFTNYRKIDNKPTSALQSRIDQAVESKLPYRIELATTGGVTFKNNEGESLVKPRLYKGGKPITSDVTWRWSLDGNVTTGMTYTVRGADVTDTATLTISAYIGNDEVAVDEISFVNVLDGPKGEDGRTPYVHWAYADNADGTGLTTSDNGQRYIGHYSDYTQADSTDKTMYRWADRWAKIPEDIQADIDSKADQALTQEQLNALNEKNQILEAEMQAKASMEAFSELEKTYHAFVAKNEKDSAQSEQDLIEAGRRIELLTTQFGGLKELKTFIDTYMSSSNEGLIIGKNDASSTIKVSSDRISMFSAGEEVMYISQGVIHIDNGIFTKSLQIGRFRTEQYGLNNDMNVIRYVG